MKTKKTINKSDVNPSSGEILPKSSKALPSPSTHSCSQSTRSRQLRPPFCLNSKMATAIEGSGNRWELRYYSYFCSYALTQCFVNGSYCVVFVGDFAFLRLVRILGRWDVSILTLPVLSCNSVVYNINVYIMSVLKSCMYGYFIFSE